MDQKEFRKLVKENEKQIGELVLTDPETGEGLAIRGTLNTPEGDAIVLTNHDETRLSLFKFTTEETTLEELKKAGFEG